uniref:Uncharacterized protein n=1 Tax=Kalanchoe fedtschenkoi TaxID=63787 RepID=A0A7N0USJ2_KALFE
MSSNLLSGIKVIPRHRIDEDLNEPSVSPDAKNRRSSKEKRRSVKNKGSDDELERISKRKKKKKWYSSEEYSVSSSGSETETSGSEVDAKKKNRKRKKKIKKSISKRSSSCEDDSGSSCEEGRNSVTGKKKKDKRKGNKEERDVDDSKNKIDDKRKELGLDWMLRPNEVGEGKAGSVNVEELEEPQVEEVIKANPRELNPYLKNDGDGYPDEAHEAANSGSSQLFSTSVVGDGGASWRLKALKRAQEQAAREGKRVEEVYIL